VFVIDIEAHHDRRGFFARTWADDEFAAHGLETRVVQCSLSFNQSRGTLRGMHYQRAPWQETKLVRCTRGRLYDVALDLRRGSPTFLKWFAIELTSDDRRAIYIPEGFAHGFQTLEDETEVVYQISQCYEPAAAEGVRWNDPAFAIEWPIADPILSDRDATFPDFSISESGG
jgi:dTDP-4-dehydrorhamnose 3,5-epimerase